MGLVEALSGKRVYLDTNILIYLIEGNPTYQTLMQEFGQALSQGDFEATSSHITLTELLPPLVKRGDTDVIEATLHLLQESGLIALSSADEDICIQAAFLRAETGMKTPDALHAATAIFQGCHIFLTNDAGVKAPKPLKVILLSDVLDAKN